MMNPDTTEIENAPLVSACLITFNHETFIADAIRGFLIQDEKFPMELVIGEDHSTDKTRYICEQFQKKDPEKIRILNSTANIGPAANFLATLLACRGKYIACCEGDDYWTSPSKLKKQVGFLEGNPEYSICTHNTQAYFQNRNKMVDRERADADFCLEDFVLRNVTGWESCSIVFRNSEWMRKTIANEIFQKSSCGDWMLSFAALMEGKMRFFGDSMGVYRIHDGAMYSSKPWLQQFQMHISGAMAIDALSNHEFRDAIVNYNAKKLFSEPTDEEGRLTVAIDELLTVYQGFEHKKWRKLLTRIMLKRKATQSFYLKYMIDRLFQHMEPVKRCL